MTTLIVFAGLPGVGKTTIARKLARALGGTCYLRVDEIETAIIDGDPMLEPGPEGYRVAAALSVSNLVLGTDVIVDSVNPLTVTRQMFTDAAQHAKAIHFGVEITCSDLVQHKSRVEYRTSDIAGLSLPTWERVANRSYEPWPTADLKLDSAALSPDSAVQAILSALL